MRVQCEDVMIGLCVLGIALVASICVYVACLLSDMSDSIADLIEESAPFAEF